MKKDFVPRKTGISPVAPVIPIEPWVKRDRSDEVFHQYKSNGKTFLETAVFFDEAQRQCSALTEIIDSTRGMPEKKTNIKNYEYDMEAFVERIREK